MKHPIQHEVPYPAFRNNLHHPVTAFCLQYHIQHSVPRSACSTAFSMQYRVQYPVPQYLVQHSISSTTVLDTASSNPVLYPALSNASSTYTYNCSYVGLVGCSPLVVLHIWLLKSGTTYLALSNKANKTISE